MVVTNIVRNYPVNFTVTSFVTLTFNIISKSSLFFQRQTLILPPKMKSADNYMAGLNIDLSEKLTLEDQVNVKQ